MQLDNVFGIAGTALNAQAIRMNTTASNLANANSVAGSEEEAYRGRRPLFKALCQSGPHRQRSCTHSQNLGTRQSIG
jgi:flagellar basal body rod protein FlgC